MELNESEGVRMTLDRYKDCPPNGVHEESGMLCLVGHYDAEGKLEAPCHVCRKCGRYIRPDAMDKPVPIKMCEKCGEKEGQVWSNPEFVKDDTGGWRCYPCYEAKKKSPVVVPDVFISNEFKAVCGFCGQPNCSHQEA